MIFPLREIQPAYVTAHETNKEREKEREEKKKKDGRGYNSNEH